MILILSDRRDEAVEMVPAGLRRRRAPVTWWDPGDFPARGRLTAAFGDGGYRFVLDPGTGGTPLGLAEVRAVWRRRPNPPTPAASVTDPSHRRDATPHDEIVDQCLILNEVANETEPVPTEDPQAAADEFRRGRGLYDRATTPAWLAEMGMTPERFETYVGGVARRRAFRRRREAELGAARLAADPRAFDLVRAVWITGPKNGVAAHTGDLARVGDGGLAALAAAGDVETTIAERPALDLPAPLRDMTPGETAGPVPYGGAFLAGTVPARREARQDERTLAAAGRAARRARATIEWHWS